MGAAQAAQGVTKAEYDAAASRSSSDFEDVEKIRAERKIRIAAGRKEFDSLMLKLDKTETSSEFVEARNALSLYLIGKGETPEELNIKRTIGRVKDAYASFIAQLRKTAPKQESIGSGSNGATR